MKLAFVVVFLSLHVLSSAQSCQERDNCGACVESTECAWCNTDGTCRPGSAIGPENKETCPDWTWKQCSANGQTLVWVIVGIAGGILLIAIGAIAYCCNKRSSRKKEVLLRDYVKMFEENPPAKKDNSQWAERREQMRAKYAFLRKDEEDQNEDENM